MTTIYGIKNCPTVQKAIKWLEANNIEYTFWDYKKQGIDTEHLETWCKLLTWQKVLNRSGMMFRKADETIKSKIIDQNSAIEFMLTTPTSIKRPMLEFEKSILVGFVVEDYKFVTR